jgi:hypothetical protein
MFHLRNINKALAMPVWVGAEGGSTTRSVLDTSRVLASPPFPSQNYSSELLHYFGELVMEAPYEKVGRIAHFYSKASVAVVELNAPLNKGDKILIKGSTTNVEQTVDSMEIEHKQIPTAQAGQSIGMKVNDRVRENDIVYRVRS